MIFFESSDIGHIIEKYGISKSTDSNVSLNRLCTSTLAVVIKCLKWMIAQLHILIYLVIVLRATLVYLYSFQKILKLISLPFFIKKNRTFKGWNFCYSRAEYYIQNIILRNENYYIEAFNLKVSY